MQQYDNLINGEWRAGASYSPNVNPSNLGDVLGPVSYTHLTLPTNREV